MIKQQHRSIQNVSENMRIGQTAIRRWLAQYGVRAVDQKGKERAFETDPRARGSRSGT